MKGSVEPDVEGPIHAPSVDPNRIRFLRLRTFFLFAYDRRLFIVVMGRVR